MAELQLAKEIILRLLFRKKINEITENESNLDYKCKY